MSIKSYREQSKRGWGEEESKGVSLAQINTGCLQRIADSVENMEKPYIKLLEDLEFYRRGYIEREAEIEHLERRITSLKGAITKLKRR